LEGKISDELIAKAISREIDFTPLGIINRLYLLRPIYKKTARNGHFTDATIPWEKLDNLIIKTLQNI